ncbi:MAG: hypothetical protein CL938_15825 [Deltaproteobacteria bacterium]|jgi:hypothetical protein|nr:hypothetical protein [Deltaproteobacteria bacterium]
MDRTRRSLLVGLASLPLSAIGARLGLAADPRPARKQRVLDGPIGLKSGDVIENLELVVGPRFRWKPHFGVIWGSNVQDVLIRNVSIVGPQTWAERWNVYSEPKGAPPTGIPTQLNGIRMHGAKNVTIEQVRIEGLPRYGITGFGYDDCVIRDVEVTRCVVGITIKHLRPSHRLLVEGIRVHDTWGPAHGLWKGRGGGVPSKVHPGAHTGGDGIVLDTVREGILRNCDVRGEHYGSYKLVNPIDFEAHHLEGMSLMVQGTSDKQWKIHKEPARKIRLHDSTFDKSRGKSGKIRRDGNVLQISWHVHDLEVERCKLRADGMGGHGIQLALDAHARVVDCTFEGFNGMRGGQPCFAADVYEDSSLNADFEQRNRFVNQERKVKRR